MNGVKAEVLSNTLEVIMDADKTVIVTYKSIPHTHIAMEQIGSQTQITIGMNAPAVTGRTRRRIASSG